MAEAVTDYVDEECSESLLDFLDDGLSDGKFEEIQEFLDTADLERFSSVNILLTLSLTWHGKQHLPNRDAFVTRAEAVLIQQLGRDRAMNLLKPRR